MKIHSITTVALVSLLTSVSPTFAESVSISKSQVPGKTRPLTAPDPNQSQCKVMEVCFVLDTTGSMGGLIDGAKKKIWTIANQIVQSNNKPETIRFGLIGYRDRGDTYVTKLHGLTDDLDSIYLNLSKFSAGGGGDHPESVNQALQEAVEKMQWSLNKDTKRIIFLVGDAPPKMNYSDDTKFYESCALAVKKDISINTLQCGTNSDTTNTWTSIANLGGGKFAMIPQDGGTVQVQSQYDKDLDQVEIEINGTIMLYGKKAVRRRENQKLDALNSASRQEKASRATFNNNAGIKKAIAGKQNDLVDMWANEEISLDDIVQENLPERYQSLGKSELKVQLDQLVEKRKTLQDKQLELVKQREDDVKEKIKELPKDSFDVQVKEMLSAE